MFTAFHRLIATALVAIVLFPRCDETSTAAASSPVADPGITMVGGSPEQRARMWEAIRRFTTAGLQLPALTVEFGVEDVNCAGHHGLFRASSMTIGICSGVESVFEHELAHAWIQAAVTDETRQEFMAFRGYRVWSDPAVPWNRRGTEGAAFVIQQGFASVPLPPALGNEFTSRLQAFELLTGVPAPRLATWLLQRPVPCEERPTTLSRQLPDATGRVCAHNQSEQMFDTMSR